MRNTGNIPLCVDLDGTLVRTDTLLESLLQLFKRSPFRFILTLFSLIRGRAYFKHLVAGERYDRGSVPMNPAFYSFLKDEYKNGRTLILATAAPRKIAERISEDLGIFDEVLASDEFINLSGRNKAHVLLQRFGEKGFEYAGNESRDIHIWRHARSAILVNASVRLMRKVSREVSVSHVFDDKLPSLPLFLSAIRPHQWLKNTLLFIPVLTSHTLFDLAVFLNTILAVVAFCFVTSGVYLINDMFDVQADRAHPRKCKRPFASGNLSLSWGILASPCLVGIGFLLSAFLSQTFMLILGVYFFSTLLYSVFFKQLIFIDVLLLAGLYTLRIVAGHAVNQLSYSFWLLNFSIFFFLSLALVKRYTELVQLGERGYHKTNGRAYLALDLPLIGMCGISSGYLSVLILALYVHSSEVMFLYRYPDVLLLLIPLFIYWMSRIWFQAHRNTLNDDPIVWTISDPTSYAVGILSVLVILMAM